MTVPLRDAPAETVDGLRSRLLDGSAPLAARYRALFALRNIAGAGAEAALVAGACEFVSFVVWYLHEYVQRRAGAVVRYAGMTLAAGS
jgi:L-serine deaminase